MGPPRDAAHLLRTGQCRRAAKQVNEEPQDKVKHGRHFEEERKEENRKQNNQPRCRKKYQICTKHACNRTGSADRWNDRVRIRKQVRQTSDTATQQIENRKADRSHLVFDVVAENPKRPHVRDDVKPAAMQELMREDRPVTIYRKPDVSSPIRVSKTCRHKAENIKELFDALSWKHQLKEKDQHIDKNQRSRNYRHGAARNRVLNWKHLGI